MRDRARLRYPRLLAFYQRHVGPHLGRGDRRHLEFSHWAARGVELMLATGTHGIRFEREEIWVDDGAGCLWAYTPGKFGSALWAEFGRRHEEREIELLAEALPTDGTFVDVGANIGSHSIRLARRMPDLRVLAFEPVAMAFETLLRNAAKNGVADRIDARRLALSEHSGTLRLTTRLQGENFVVPETENVVEGTVETVECRRLDDMVTELDGGVDAIKCDVEGAELSVLRGATTTLERFKPALLIEVEERYMRRYGSGAAEVFTFLASRGYAYRRIVQREVLPPSGSLARDLAEGNNFFFTPSGGRNTL